jgi:heme A synthase
VILRGEAKLIIGAAYTALGTVVVQIFIAAALVELELPAVLRSLHQAVGTLVWVAVVALALLSRRGALGVGVPARVPAPRRTLHATAEAPT